MLDYDESPDHFSVHWDNDIVTLSREDAAELVVILQKWISGIPTKLVPHPTPPRGTIGHPHA